MFDEGICTERSAVGAAHYFARASELGESSATLELAATVGLGEGSEQSYERAGQICRQGGLDPQNRASTYSLGYACTLRAVAGRLARQATPPEALARPTAPVQIEFRPTDDRLDIVSLPPVRRADDPGVGTHVRKPLADLAAIVATSWRQAAAQAPKPDPARLDDHALALPIDIDLALEVGMPKAERSSPTKGPALAPGELRPIGLRP